MFKIITSSQILKNFFYKNLLKTEFSYNLSLLENSSQRYFNRIRGLNNKVILESRNAFRYIRKKHIVFITNQLFV